MSIRIGIYGYGNLGKGVECAIRQNSDMELKAVFTRRNPDTVKINTPGVAVYHCDKAIEIAINDLSLNCLLFSAVSIFLSILISNKIEIIAYFIEN